MFGSRHLYFTRAGAPTAVAMSSAALPALAVDITVAGATSACAVHTKWAEAYTAPSGNHVDDQGIGSSGGVEQYRGQDRRPRGHRRAGRGKRSRCAHLVQFPAVMGGVTLVAGLAAVASGQSKLGARPPPTSRGAITTWNDPRIAKLDPGLKLPGTAIRISHRSDGSGTPFVFTN